MSTLAKIIVSTLLSLSLFSCNFDFNINSGVKGNGNVITEERTVSESFNTIKASEGLAVILTQSNTESITVEADENLMDLIVTEIEDGVLKIHTRENIGKSKSKKIMVNVKALSRITSTSGSSVSSTNTISSNQISLKSTSGSRLKIDINATEVNCKSTSGSSMSLSGKTDRVIAEATSGSRIKAEDLIAESGEIKATSGASASVNTSEKLIAKANSGASIKYYGDPEFVEKNDAVSGSISKR